MEVAGLFALLLALPAAAGAGNLDELFLDDQAALSGGAVIAAGSEPGSAMYNPAGVASISRPTLNLDASAYSARYYHIPRLVRVMLPDGEGSIQLDTSSFSSTPSSLVYGARINDDWSGVLGIFTRNQLDVLSVNDHVFHGKIPSTGEDYTYEQGAELDLRFKAYSFGPAVGWRAAHWLRLGLGVFGTYQRISQANRFTGDYYKDASLSYSDPSGYFKLYDYRLATRTEQRLGVSAYSMEGSLGAQVDLPGKMTLGLAFHSPKFRIYEAVEQTLVFDGNATTQVASVFPAGLVMHLNLNGNAVNHPYIWQEAYRGHAGLARKFEAGYLAAECDFSDLPDERGKGMVFNYRLGFISGLSEHWSMGAGISSDLKPSGAAITGFGATAIDYYGATLGLRHDHEYLAKEKDAPLGELKAMRMTTTLSFNYVHGYGEYGGVSSDPTQPIATLPVYSSPFISDEFSAHLGGGFAF